MSAALIPALLALFFLAGLPAFAQRTDPARIEMPFEHWAAEGERTDMPWDIKFTRPALMYNQRQAVSLQVSLPAKGLQKRSVARELHTLIKVQDSAGRWLPEEAYDVQALTGRLPSRARLEIRFMMYLRPGEYAVHTFLVDRVREERNHDRHEIRVPPMRNDPLPEAGREFPVLEFVAWSEREGARRDLPGRLHLPVRAKRPLRLDIIVNFSSRPSRYGRLHRNNTRTLLEMLGVIAQMELPEGSTVRLTALDVIGRRVLFQFDNVSGLDLPRMREYLDQALDPHTVDVDTLARRLEAAEFFRAHMESALQWPSPMHSAGLRGGGAAPEQGRVFLLLGAPTLFPNRTPVRKLELKNGCGCRFFYLRRAADRGNPEVGLWDQLERILDPIDPRIFEISEPRDLRKAVANIIRELER